LKPWPHGDPDAVARAILAQPAYRRIPASTDVAPQPSVWQILWDWIVDHVLRPLFGPISHALGSAHPVGAAFGIVLIAIALLALAFLVFRLAVAFVGPALARGRDVASGVALDAERTREDWLAAARAAAARGDYARAIAALFSASLAALDERSIVPFDPARTPGEYRRMVRQATRPASAAFDELSDRFVRAAYAPSVPARADFDAAERAFAAFEPLAKR
jgi:hypothetical protein